MDLEDRVFSVLADPGQAAVQDLIHPYRHGPYPLDHIGPFVRYPAEYTWKSPEGGWIDFQELDAAVLAAVPDLRSCRPEDRRSCYEGVFDGLAEDDYRQEWAQVGALKGIQAITREQPMAVKANEKAGEEMAAHIVQRVNGGGQYTLMEWGPGELGTTGKILDRLPPSYVPKIRFILIDVVRAALDASTQKLVAHYRVSPENILAVEEYLQTIGSWGELERYRGQVDGIVSGACVHQSRRFEPIFETGYALLAPGGQLFYWDWLHDLWKGPVVKAGGNLPDEEAVEGAKEIARIWVGLHGYGTPAAMELSPLQQKLEGDFDAAVRREGFHFHRWMQENLAGVEPRDSTRTPYRSAEGQRDPAIPEAILRQLFGAVEHHRFPHTRILHGFSARKPAERITLS